MYSVVPICMEDGEHHDPICVAIVLLHSDDLKGIGWGVVSLNIKLVFVTDMTAMRTCMSISAQSDPSRVEGRWFIGGV